MDFSKNGLLYFFLFFWKSIPLCYNPPFSLLNYYHESIHTYCFFLSSVHFLPLSHTAFFIFLFYHTDFLFPTHSNHIIILFTFVVCNLCGVNRNNETKSLCYALAYTHLHQCEFSQYFSDFSAHTIAIPAGISQNGSQLPKKATSTDGCFFMQKPPPQVSSI